MPQENKKNPQENKNVAEIVMSFDQLAQELGMNSDFKIIHVFQNQDDVRNKNIRILVNCPSGAKAEQIKSRDKEKISLSVLDEMNLTQLEILRKTIELKEELRKVDNRSLKNFQFYN